MCGYPHTHELSELEATSVRGLREYCNGQPLSIMSIPYIKPHLKALVWILLVNARVPHRESVGMYLITLCISVS